MIKLFRIATSEFINDISGTGARIYGGRWNHQGSPVVYASSSRSLAALEFLVHAPMALAPENLSILEINIIDTVEIEWVNESQLPLNWRDYPAPEQLADIGTNWLKAKSSLLLEIPSAVVNQEVNTLINPLHEDIKNVSLASIERFCFDSRLLHDN
ncbi:MAG: RES family NAD+ phosphorylase [Thermodesulfobacteriota bacterium]|nr:RES family NAD+ phosphorylase [Thermodesulfobacteriota bacterium]